MASPAIHGEQGSKPDSNPDSQHQGECPFWCFSLAFYGRSGVAVVLLEAQDRFGADINMLLFALWQAQRRRRVSIGEMSALAATVAEWKSRVVLPARALRRALKAFANDDPGCYDQAKALELACERVQQNRMFGESERAGMGDVAEGAVSELAMANINVYAQTADIELPEMAMRYLATEVRSASEAA